MLHRAPFRLLTSALLLTSPLAGCGDDGDATGGAASTTDPATTDPATGGSTTSATGDPPTTGPGTTDVDDTTGPGTSDPSSTGPQTTGTGGDDTTGSGVEDLPPTDSADALELWLAAGSYREWAGESKVHMSTGPHGGNVRTYVNAPLVQSLEGQSPMHPQGAATVKELYGASQDTIIGYAVMVKVAPDSQGGDGWYWYERINATVYADGTGVGLCSGCHSGGVDYFLTPFPLQ